MDQPQKPNAQVRLSLALGANIFEAELLRDKVDELTAKLAESEATVAQLLKSMKPEEEVKE